MLWTGSKRFQSTPSGRRETISFTHIHSPDNNFNPLPPDGGRRVAERRNEQRYGYFNPLPPDGGRPVRSRRSKPALYFNPLPPDGGRPDLLIPQTFLSDFNPLPPDGGRHSRQIRTSCTTAFQSTPSGRRETSFTLMPEEG